jgi:hypothetical protein
LCSLLRDAHLRVRSAAAQALGRIGEAQAAEPLCAALRDPDQDVRRAAAEALQKIGVPGDPVTRVWHAVGMQNWAQCVELRGVAVEPLCAVLQDEEKDVRAAAAEALAQIGDDRAVEPLLASNCLQYSRGVAEWLVRLFREGNLSARAKQRILSERRRIERPHNDHPVVYSDCHRDAPAITL